MRAFFLLSFDDELHIGVTNDKIISVYRSETKRSKSFIEQLKKNHGERRSFFFFFSNILNILLSLFDIFRCFNILFPIDRSYVLMTVQWISIRAVQRKKEPRERIGNMNMRSVSKQFQVVFTVNVKLPRKNSSERRMFTPSLHFRVHFFPKYYRWHFKTIPSPSLARVLIF